MFPAHMNLSEILGTLLFFLCAQIGTVQDYPVSTHPHERISVSSAQKNTLFVFALFSPNSRAYILYFWMQYALYSPRDISYHMP